LSKKLKKYDKITPKAEHEAWWKLVASGKSGVEAYQIVYPDSTKSTAYVGASKLMARYADKIFSCVQSKLKDGSLRAVGVIEEIMNSSKAPEAVKLKAAQAILDMTGHKAVEKKEISIKDLNEDEVDTKLKKLLGEDIIEAEIVKH